MLGTSAEGTDGHGHGAGHEPFHEGPGLGLQVQELELSFRANVDPYLRGDFYLAATPEQLEIEEAFISTLALPGGLKARAGWFRPSFGRFNGQHYLETQPFVDQPLPNRRFLGPEGLRSLAVELSWLMPLPWYAMLYATVGTAQDETSFGGDPHTMQGPADVLTVLRLEQFHDLSDRWSLKWGLSFAQGPHGEVARTEVAGVDVYLRWRDVETVRYVALQFEGMVRRRHTDVGEGVLEGAAYAQLDWRIDRHWELALRGDLAGWPEAWDVRAGSPPLDGFAVLGRQERLALAGSYYASEFHRWRLQYALDHVQAMGGRTVHEVFLQYQAVLGAHGAHPF